MLSIIPRCASVKCCFHEVCCQCNCEEGGDTLKTAANSFIHVMHKRTCERCACGRMRGNFCACIDESFLSPLSGLHKSYEKVKIVMILDTSDLLLIKPANP